MQHTSVEKTVKTWRTIQRLIAALIVFVTLRKRLCLITTYAKETAEEQP